MFSRCTTLQVSQELCPGLKVELLIDSYVVDDVIINNNNFIRKD